MLELMSMVRCMGKHVKCLQELLKLNYTFEFSNFNDSCIEIRRAAWLFSVATGVSISGLLAQSII